MRRMRRSSTAKTAGRPHLPAAYFGNRDRSSALAAVRKIATALACEPLAIYPLDEVGGYAGQRR